MQYSRHTKLHPMKLDFATVTYVMIIGHGRANHVGCQFQLKAVLTPVMSSSVRIKKSTVLKWKSDYSWLKFECSDDGYVKSLACTICQKHQERLRCLRNFSNAFVSGVNGSFKKDNVVKHNKSDMHSKAINLDKSPASISEIYSSTPLGRAFSNAKTDERERLNKLFDIAYMMAKEEIAFMKFPSFVELEKQHGVELGNTYINEIKCQEFTKCIGLSMKNDLIKAVKQSAYYSVLTDGSTDTSITEKELIYIKYINTDGVPETHFFRLMSVDNAKAEGLKKLIEKSLEGLHMDSKIVGFCADGASVNLGCKSGVSALLKQIYPWLISIHCLNHRLELACKDAFKGTYLDEVIELLLSMYLLYHNSPKRLREMKSLAEIMDEHVKVPNKANGTRWLQHKGRACESLLQSYSIIVSHLENMAEDPSTKKEDKVKMKGYLRKLKSFKFVIHLLFFKQIIQPLSKFSLSLQRDSIDLLWASALLEKTFTQLKQIKDGSDTTNTVLNNLLKSATDDPNSVKFKDVDLQVDPRSVDSFNTSKLKYVDCVEKCLRNRFGQMDTDPVFQCFKVLDTNIWPTEKSQLMAFGNAEVAIFITRFEKLLTANNVVIDNITEEWQELKLFASRNLLHLSRSEIWSLIITKYQADYPNLKHVIMILLVFPVSNAKLERGFSGMLRVKTDFRNRLSEEIVEHLMNITLEGPEPSKFNPLQAVDLFLTEKPRRLNAEAYGPRPETLKRKAGENLAELEAETRSADKITQSEFEDLMTVSDSVDQQ